MLHAHQRIGDVDVGGEGCLTHDSAHINGIGDGSVDGFDVVVRTFNGDGCGIGGNFSDAVSGDEAANDTRANFDGARGTGVEVDVNLRRDDARDGNSTRHLDLPWTEVKSAFTGLHTGEIEYGADVRRLNVAHGAFGAADHDLDFERAAGSHKQILRSVMKFDGSGDDGLDRRDAAEDPPEADSNGQREQLEAKVVEHVAAEEFEHG